MSKMDRNDTQTIYEIYRACRLCGAGAGYKMPIIQNVVDLEDTDVELKQKIRECVQIEVDQDDKMPPLICELCVDKVNDFYEFLDMCRQINKRTRLRLGLPPQSMPKGAPDAGDCILGLTEPVFVNEDSDGEPLAKHKKKENKTKSKSRDVKELKVKEKEKELKVKIEPIQDARFKPSPLSRKSRREATPPRTTRNTKKDDNITLNKLQEAKEKKKEHKSILKKELKALGEDATLHAPRVKRSRDKEPVISDLQDTPIKKVKILLKPIIKESPKETSKSSPKSTKEPKITPKESPKTSPKSKTQKPSPKTHKETKRDPSPPKTCICEVCAYVTKTTQGYISHMKVHSVGYTSKKLACNACGDWFPTPEEAADHHQEHQDKSLPYTCRRCTADFRSQQAYEEHFTNDQCIPEWDELPDVKCYTCWHMFATHNLLDHHDCPGEDGRPGGNCKKCDRSFPLLKNLAKHEATCRRKGEPIVGPGVMESLRPLQVRVARCDPLLHRPAHEHYDVSTVSYDFGLDRNCIYPYRLDGMVSINEDIKKEILSQKDYSHWDSDSETEPFNLFPKKSREVDTLSILTLKTIFSQKCIGKVPKKRRREKFESTIFESLNNEVDEALRSNIKNNISNIINSLGGDDDDDMSSQVSDSLIDDQLSLSISRIQESLENGDASKDDGEYLNGDELKNDKVIKSNEDMANNDDDINNLRNSTEKDGENISVKHEVDNSSTNDSQEIQSSLIKDEYLDKNNSQTESSQDSINILDSESKDSDLVIDSDTNNKVQSDLPVNAEDKKLMDDLDAQIGENNDKLTVQVCTKYNDIEEDDFSQDFHI